MISRLNAVQLNIFSSRLSSICDEMGLILRRSAFSTNIKDRLDFSCALFDPRGSLVAQAAHVPVHLGSMAYAMSGIVSMFDWHDGDMVMLNDPFRGGTHLPDVTLVAPVFVGDELIGFVANRAHHADIGSHSPGSMPVSKNLEHEGVLISPCKLLQEDEFNPKAVELIAGLGVMPGEVINGDFMAQISANRQGVQRLRGLFEKQDYSVESYLAALEDLGDYAGKVGLSLIQGVPSGEYYFEDFMDSDGFGVRDIPIRVRMEVTADSIRLDFDGTAAQVNGNINCPASVTAAAVFYIFRCLMPEHTPSHFRIFECIHLDLPEHSLINASAGCAVAAGNVETSMRLVDVVLGALSQAIPDRIPAASQGTMNNVAIGARGDSGSWDYYETLAGGCGASSTADGLSARHSHMTNTLNTPIESLEQHFPLRVRRYELRPGSGGVGLHNGGNGLIREYEFLQAATCSLLTERRTHEPWGVNSDNGQSGRNLLNGRELPDKYSGKVAPGDILTVETPGGGGWSHT